MPRPTLALACIAKNEEENLPKLLESVQGCFDEIHITDTGSTDKTVELAKELGAQVHHFPWIDDFAAARNASFEPVKTDYVMWLDLDDSLVNPDAFKAWREDVMPLYDYWFAPYHYAFDDKGNPACVFMRERVFRRAKGVAWRYFVHEGVIPTGQNQLTMQVTQAWHVKHRRTVADLAKDKGRNLNLFLKNKDNLNARMRYYFGKEYFENGKPLEAVMELQQAVADPSLELHDRVLAMQYLCSAYQAVNQFEKCIQMAHQGIQLMPHRAEFHCMIGDCYRALGRPFDSLPHYASAKACDPTPKGMIQAAIFTTQAYYGPYPTTEMSRVLANLGALDQAAEFAQESILKFKDPQAESTLTQILDFKEKILSYKKAKPCEDIVFTTAPQTAYEFDPGLAKEKAMGGSETALMEMAYWIKKLSGRPVKVFTMRKDHKTFDGVDYYPADMVNGYFAENKPHFHVAWRHATKITDAPSFVWSHDLMTPGVENTNAYTKVLCLTPFHKRFMMSTQLVPADKIYTTRNGVNPDRFTGHLWDKDPYRFVFGSSPDRGLVRCMKVLDRVRKVYPQVNLSVHYGIEHLDKYGHKELRLELEKMFQERKDWVTYHGATQQEALMASYRSAAYNVQPSDWVETSCISARELLYCGVYPIFRKVGGVSDTLADAAELRMCSLVDSPAETEEQLDLYATEVCNAIKEQRYLNVSANAADWSWEGVARQWLQDLPLLE